MESGCSWGSHCPELEPGPEFGPHSHIQFGMYNSKADGTNDVNLAGGWRLMTLSDFVTYRSEFVETYNNHGIKAIANFHSDNCCIAVKDTTAGNVVSLVMEPSAYGYQFPAAMPPDNQATRQPSYQAALQPTY